MSLKLSTEIPYGNAALVEINEEENMNVVRFTANAHGGLERLWFCFRLINDGAVPKTKLVLKHFESMLGGNINGASAITPVIREQEGAWKRLPSATLEWTDDGRAELIWMIDTPVQYADVAVCYPYGFPEIDCLLQECGGYWKKDEIDISQQGNPMIRLSNHYSTNDDASGLYLLCRQHAGEVGGSWVLDGFLRYLAEVKSDLMVWCVPLANIDGVLNGDYGKNPFPHDLNRAWSWSACMRHEIKNIMIDMKRWEGRCKPARVMDFHCPGVTELGGTYTFITPEDENNADVTERLERYGNVLGNLADKEFVKVSHYKAGSTWGNHPCMREYVKAAMDIPAITFETSYMQANGKVLTIDDYRQTGRLLAQETLKQINNK